MYYVSAEACIIIHSFNGWTFFCFCYCVMAPLNFSCFKKIYSVGQLIFSRWCLLDCRPFRYDWKGGTFLRRKSVRVFFKYFQILTIWVLINYLGFKIFVPFHLRFWFFFRKLSLAGNTCLVCDSVPWVDWSPWFNSRKGAINSEVCSSLWKFTYDRHVTAAACRVSAFSFWYIL